MLAGATIFLTILFALVFGILSGWAALAAILYAFGNREELKPAKSALRSQTQPHPSTT
jgi:hypothetical protein